MLKLEGKAEFRQGSALEMPFSPGTFDGAYMIHVGMNVADKAGVFREVARVLKPGGRFSIFDIMGTGNDLLEFPLPWAVSSDTSFVTTTGDYRTLLEAAGFRVEHERGRHQFALEENAEENGARTVRCAACDWGAHSHGGEGARHAQECQPGDCQRAGRAGGDCRGGWRAMKI